MKRIFEFAKIDKVTIILILIWEYVFFEINKTFPISFGNRVILAISIIFFQAVEFNFKQRGYKKFGITYILKWTKLTYTIKLINTTMAYERFKNIEYFMSWLYFTTILPFASIVFTLNYLTPLPIVVKNVLLFTTILLTINFFNSLILTVFHVADSKESRYKKFLLHYDEEGNCSNGIGTKYIHYHEEILALELHYKEYKPIDLQRELKYLDSLKIKLNSSHFDKYFFGAIASISTIIITSIFEYLKDESQDIEIQKVLELSYEEAVIFFLLPILVVILIRYLYLYITIKLFKYTKNEQFLRQSIVEDLIKQKSEHLS